MKRVHSLLILCLITWVPLHPLYGETSHPIPQVVTSITPFYSLVASIMHGVGTPKLLVKPGASPHDYALKPSDMEALKNADIIFWGGPELESFLVKTLKSSDLKQTVRIVQFDTTKGLLLLPVRSGPAETDPDGDGDSHAHCGSHCKDMHFWLDPNNAMLLIDSITETLSLKDPFHAALYKKNAQTFKKHLIALDIQLQEKLKKIQKMRFIVFHDAYQYFEHHYGLQSAGAITLNPEIPPSAKRLNNIRTTIQNKNAVCVFREPQFPSKVVQSIVEDTHVRTGTLDPLGSQSENGYFELLENLSNSLQSCLIMQPQPSE